MYMAKERYPKKRVLDKMHATDIQNLHFSRSSMQCYAAEMVMVESLTGVSFIESNTKCESCNAPPT